MMSQLPANVRELLHNTAENRIEFMQSCTLGVGDIGVQGAADERGEERAKGAVRFPRCRS
jgi:hypothetical protein